MFFWLALFSFFLLESAFLNLIFYSIFFVTAFSFEITVLVSFCVWGGVTGIFRHTHYFGSQAEKERRECQLTFLFFNPVVLS